MAQPKKWIELDEKDYNQVAEWLVETGYNDTDVLDDLIACSEGRITHNEMCTDARVLVGDYLDYINDN